MSNRCWCDVDPGAFDHNLRQIRAAAPGAKVAAVVKADAYGHWAKEAIKHMSEPDFFAVATINEALELEDARKPIIILYPLTDPEDITAAVLRDIRINIGSWESLKATLSVARALDRRAKVHLEVDTGMARTGFFPEEAPRALEEILASEFLSLEGVFTHFQDGSDPAGVAQQLEAFQRGIRGVPAGVIRHAASSSALLRFPSTHLDMVRPGIALYGSPPDEACQGVLDLRPALSLRARVIQIKKVPPGHGISYGARFVPGKTKRIATLGVGYADGYPPVLANRGQVLLGGKRRRVLGAVCMDAIMVDASEEPLPQVGDVATVIGSDGQDEITALELARAAGTIPYDILTGIGRRVKRIYRASPP